MEVQVINKQIREHSIENIKNKMERKKIKNHYKLMLQVGLMKIDYMIQ
ncbi:hypothetical protein [Methanosphaera sp. WGK6]|nr:hypothetical protein [Methanosphaera sp. WGK6]